MKKRPFRRLIAAFLTMALFVTLLPNIPGGVAEASGEEKKITNAQQLYDATVLSRTSNGSSGKYVLGNDIIIDEGFYDSIADEDVPYISFGSDDISFKGIFDGNGYTISGLKYKEDLTKPIPDTGLFAWTQGATIRNLVIEDANIEADARAGIVVGYAENTTIENVKVESSGLAVRAADNVLLIGTDLGVCGGGIVGEAYNSVMYNCEVNNCFIRTNNTSGVAALAGKDLVLGGIAGSASGSTIEYCRVIGDEPYGENNDVKTRISLYYDVVANVVGGNTLYAGGIAGKITDRTEIIDSFSTADMYTYCASYVTVLGMNVGHIGGIVAGIGDADCKITRCHYAGTAESFQLNGIVVGIIPQYNVNISGVADYFTQIASYNDTLRNNVYGVFFKDSLNPEVDMDSLRDLTGLSITSNGNYGPWSNDLYESRAAWESFGFDFTGTTDRTSAYHNNEVHHNKWVMDYKLGIPVHGSSAAATFDFPGAGEVSIAGTDLVSSAVSTTDPYSFAVQGAASSDNKLTLTYKPTDENYRLDGWWRIPDIYVQNIAQDHSYFDNLFENYETLENVPIYGKEETQDVTNPVDKSEIGSDGTYTYEPENVVDEVTGWEDNDLFVARVQALVKFHDANWNSINRENGEVDKSTVNDWDYYNTPLPNVTPVNGSDSKGAVLIGWTTNSESKFKKEDLNSISSANLTALKEAGDFYETGDPITKPMQLYPVYSSYLTNMKTEFEGYNRDTTGAENENTDISKRPEVGVTNSEIKDGKLVLTVTGENGSDFPDGYEFLGWYIYSGIEGSDPTADYCVGRTETLELSGVDMTEERTYIARFKYRVDYYEKCQFGNDANDSEYKESTLYKSVLHTYGKEFQNIPGLNFYREKFKHWGESSNHDSADAFSGPIYAPKKVYSVNESTGGMEDDKVYDVDILNDFPGSGEIVSEQYGLGVVWASRVEFKILSVESGYNFVGWNWESGKNILDEGKDLPYRYDNDIYPALDDNHYTFVGHFTANVTFHMPNDQDNAVVTRRYEQKVTETETNHTYTYYRHPETMTSLTHTGAAIPGDDAMKRTGEGYENYIFLGWVNGNDIDQEEQAYIWGDSFGGDYLAAAPEKVAPYLLSSEDLGKISVTEAMDFYPVYVKFDYDFTTNLHEVGFDGDETFNAPDLPGTEVKNLVVNEYGYTARLTFSVDNNETSVLKGEAEPKYQVSSVECINNTTNETTTLTPTDNEGRSYTFEIIAGNDYTFIANYNPVPVIYQMKASGDNSLKVEMKNLNQTLGASPNPLNAKEDLGANAIFQGWTTQAPEDKGAFHIVADEASMPALVNPGVVVTQPMKLWPVYRSVNIAVNSNKDSELNDEEKAATRYVEVLDPNQKRATIHAAESVTIGGQVYGFVGWYTGYDSITGEGTEFSTDPVTTLSGDAVFDETTYTAVYDQVFTINYHNTKGEVIYTAYAKANERSFIATTTIQRPNPEYDPNQPESESNKPYIEEEITGPIDGEAFSLIETNGNIPENEQFMEWQWVASDADGSPMQTRWNAFCNEEISQDMELYPVTNAVTVKNSEQAELAIYKDATTNDQGQLVPASGNYNLGIEQNADKENVVTVLLRTEYDQPYIDVIVSEKAYTGPKIADTENTAGEEISLYLAGDETLNNVSLYETKETSDAEEHDNVGIHAHFDLYGELQLTKELAQGTEADSGEVFLFKVDLGNGNIQTIPVEAGKTVTIGKIPFGTVCKVSEDSAWSWRYDVAWDDEHQNIDSTGVTLSSYHASDKVTATNRKSNDKWMDNSAYVSNQFGEDKITAIYSGKPDEKE